MNSDHSENMKDALEKERARVRDVDGGRGGAGGRRSEEERRTDRSMVRMKRPPPLSTPPPLPPPLLVLLVGSMLGTCTAQRVVGLDTRGRSSWLAELGVISVTDAPFRADPTGREDSTKSIQAALDEGYRTNVTVFFPRGTYRVTDTLNCSQTWSGPWSPPFRTGTHVLVGETPREAGGERPSLLLPPDTPGFTDRSAGKIVLFFWHQNPNSASTQTQPMNNINQILQGVDIRIGKGNYGAIGIRHRGAQGSAIEDVTIWAEDASVGIVGAAGGGGAHTNVRVVGGRFGLDLRLAQPAPTVVGASLVNQTCSA